jgi:polysaccharide export outer membrane protein
MLKERSLAKLFIETINTHLAHLNTCEWVTSVSLAGALVLVFLAGGGVYAQQQPTTGAASATQLNNTSPRASGRLSNSGTRSDDRYRIGPGDILDIRIFNKPQFNREGVRVDPRGMIRMPFIKEEIKAACHTEVELEADVTTLLKEYIREPQVTVQIRE